MTSVRLCKSVSWLLYLRCCFCLLTSPLENNRRILWWTNTEISHFLFTFGNWYFLCTISCCWSLVSVLNQCCNFIVSFAFKLTDFILSDVFVITVLRCDRHWELISFRDIAHLFNYTIFLACLLPNNNKQTTINATSLMVSKTNYQIVANGILIVWLLYNGFSRYFSTISCLVM